ncbi:uncharacterized protein LOC119363010 [Triticum dicoccoides]|uniref:uncharacterized protein LOC119363010 n=1 Tax=Triticum dicoccoides TaxID=85692 RepID=UPI000E7C10F1|nr:uncharacterized protein LOC119363010 [Triticum dicoccoides]
MDEVWPWLATLPPPGAGTGTATASIPLAASPEAEGASIVLQADCTTTADGGTAVVAFSIAVDSANGVARRVLWTSEAFAAASEVAPRLLLLAQLLDEVTALSPSITSLRREPDASSSESKLLDAEVVSAVIAATGVDDGSHFFSLALLMRLFWLCALEAPADLGFLFFQALSTDIERALAGCAPAALGGLLLSVGPDVEERFMRSLGYMLAKWCLLREMQSAPKPPAKPDVACLSYATEVHGLWVLRGYAPVLAIPRVAGATSPATITALPHELPEEPALRYGLVHQQLEAVAQVEYAVSVRDNGFIVVGVHVDNIRVRVVRLGYSKKDDTGTGEDDVDDDHVLDGERHFPSRIRLWVGPRFGSSYATGPSLGRSTGNPEREVETTRTVKGAFSGATKLGGDPRVKAKMRSSSRARNRSWRWEQEAEGSAGVFEGVLCDPATGTEVSSWRPGSREADPRSGMRRRYGGPGRAFSKMRGLVVAGDELPEEVTWRVRREAEGRTMRWRLGLKVWLSYLPNEVRSRHFETRCVEWAHEVELPLMATTPL